MRSGAFTTVSVLPNAGTPMAVRVSESGSGKPFATILIGDSGQGVTIHASDEETLEALASAIGEARARLVGAINRAQRAQDVQPELPVSAAS